MKSKNVDVERTEPCIALYPTGNANGSWMFYNMKTKKRVRRTNWQKMVTADLVIDYMNLMTELDEEVGEEEPEAEEVEPEVDANDVHHEESEPPLVQGDEDEDDSESESTVGDDEDLANAQVEEAQPEPEAEQQATNQRT